MRWRLIKREFTVRLRDKGVALPSRGDGERSPWTRRFWESTLRDADSLARRIDYVHFNPVKHGYVTCVAAWPHSSFHAFVARGVLPIDWAGGREGAPAPSGD